MPLEKAAATTLWVNFLEPLDFLPLDKREKDQQHSQLPRQVMAYLLDNTHISQEKADHNCHETVDSATRGIPLRDLCIRAV